MSVSPAVYSCCVFKEGLSDAINVDGEVLMCDTKLDFLAGKCGNIRNIPLKKIWFSKRAWKRRRAIYNCTHACIQDCYRRKDADNLIPILKGLALEIKSVLLG